MKCPNDQRQAQVLPATAQPLEVVGNLFRQVAGPDDQELREREVRPQHHEARASACRDRGSGAPCSTRVHRLARDAGSPAPPPRTRAPRAPWPTTSDQAVDRRVPVRIERHDPVHRREAHEDDVEQQPRRADDAEAARVGFGHAPPRRRPAAADHLFRQHDAAPSRRRSRSPPRTAKNGTFRYGAFNCRISSPCDGLGPRPEKQLRREHRDRE